MIRFTIEPCNDVVEARSRLRLGCGTRVEQLNIQLTAHGSKLLQRKAWDSNPHDPQVARFSKPARQPLSGYLPFVVLLTPLGSFLFANPLTSSFSLYKVDPPGIEPGFPVCRTGVFPLDHEPAMVGIQTAGRRTRQAQVFLQPPPVDLMGVEPTTPTLQGSVAPQRHAGPALEK